MLSQKLFEVLRPSLNSYQKTDQSRVINSNFNAFVRLAMTITIVEDKGGKTKTLIEMARLLLPEGTKTMALYYATYIVEEISKESYCYQPLKSLRCLIAIRIINPLLTGFLFWLSSSQKASPPRSNN